MTAMTVEQAIEYSLNGHARTQSEPARSESLNHRPKLCKS